jgi:hypothetical protein
VPASRVRAGLRRCHGAAAVLLLAAACARPPAPLAPEGEFVPVSPGEFRVMAARTTPGARALLAIHWRYDDGDAPISGRGAVRLAPPDSLRLDVGVQIVGRATLVLAGDSAWTRPGALLDQVAPNRGMLWAMFGVVRPPDGLASIERGQASDRRLYRIASGDGTVTTLELRGDTLLGATQARGRRLIGRLALTRDAGGWIVRAEATDLEHGSRFTMDVDRREAGGPFPDEIWRRP